MRCYIQSNILYVNQEDLPKYKKNGSIVRNSYFWALKSICGYSPSHGDWEFEEDIWMALARMLLFFANSGYLGDSETILEFEDHVIIPDVLRAMASKL
ncbi:MAG: hypothetical protein IGQ45_01535 [Cyanobacterium sp. T60_A2020_053]|nr:hypothetical protein [Cyanobacterium sp. T60_A2020_053]